MPPFAPRHRRTFAVATLLVLAAAARPSATAVLALRTNDAVLVAADMRSHMVGPSEAGSAAACKIVASREAVIAFAGITGIPAEGLDVREVLQKVVAPSMSLSSRMQALDATLRLVVPRLVETAIRVSPAYREKLKRDKREVFAVLLAGMEGSAPIWIARRYTRVVQGTDVRYDYRTVVCGQGCDRAPAAVLGGTPSMLKAFSRTPRERLAASWLPEATRLIQIGARESPATIGLPLSAVRVDAGGVEWLQQQPECGP